MERYRLSGKGECSSRTKKNDNLTAKDYRYHSLPSHLAKSIINI